MNRTPAHRIVSSALGLAIVFASTLFVSLPFFSDAPNAVSIAQAQFGEALDDAAPGSASQGRRTDPGNGGTDIREVDEYVEEVNNKDSSLGVLTNGSLNRQISYAYCAMVGCFEGADDSLNQTSGIIPGLGQAISFMYENPPASSQQYVAYVLDSAGINIAQPAYAQTGGLGFSSLLPILDTWARMRNLAYLFFVIMFVVIGFMIMFRQKLGGQTVVTIQQAIPQIIISLLAVTFSFAIAGLLIDLMYVSMYLMLALFGKTPTTTDYFSGNLFVIGGTLINQGVSSVNESMIQLVKSVFGDNLLTNIFGGGMGLVGAVVFAVAIVIRLFTLFFMLLQTYIGIILSIVTAPIALMLGAIPGKNNFTTWIKGLIGNLAAFPTVLFILLLFESLTSNIIQDGSGGFVPPYLGGNGSSAAVSNLIGIGMILIIPTIVEEVKKVLGAGDGVFGQFGKALKESVGAGWKRGGKTFAKTLGTGAAMGAGAGIGAGIGAAAGGIAQLRGKPANYRKRMGQGALYGGAAPVAARFAPGLIKSTYNLTKEELTQLAQRKILESAYSGIGNSQNAFVKGGKHVIGLQLQRLRNNIYGPQYNPQAQVAVPVNQVAGAGNPGAQPPAGQAPNPMYGPNNHNQIP